MITSKLSCNAFLLPDVLACMNLMKEFLSRQCLQNFAPNIWCLYLDLAFQISVLQVVHNVYIFISQEDGPLIVDNDYIAIETTATSDDDDDNTVGIAVGVSIAVIVVIVIIVGVVMLVWYFR